MTQSLDLAGIPPEQRPTATWAAALLHAVARDEAAGRRPLGLTELEVFRPRPSASSA